MNARLVRLAERENNVLKTLDDNAKRLDVFDEGLQSHIRQQQGRATEK